MVHDRKDLIWLMRERDAALQANVIVCRQFKVCSSWSKRRSQHRVANALFFACVAFCQIAWGQLPKTGSAATQPAQIQNATATQDPLGRTTPRGTVLGFLSAAYNQKYDTAAQYLDTRASGEDAAILAKQLFFVLDRRLPAKLNNVSKEPLGSLSDTIDSRRELIGSVVTEDGGGVDIYLERVDRHNAVPIWLFSRQTLVDIPDIYGKVNPSTVENFVPDLLLKKYFGVTLLGWMYFLVFLPLLYVALTLLNRLVGAGAAYAIRRWTRRTILHNPTILPHPLRLLIVSCTIFATLHQVSLSLFVRQVGSTIAALLLILAFVWAMFLVNARCELYSKRRMESRGRLSATAVLRPARRVMDLIAIVAGLIWLLHTLGINPTATLAGLGVGGIAIALAAQKTLENVIGGASLIVDGVVRVGDEFKIGEVVGTIEVIGLRSTRVRTLDRTIVTIPNGQMATMTLENLSARDRFRLRHLIRVAYWTAPAALNSVLVEIRSLLERDSRVLPLTSRVCFLNFAESGFALEVHAYIAARDWSHFLEIQEDLLIKVRELIASAGVGFALPSHTIYLRDEIEIDGASPPPARHRAMVEKEAGHELQKR